MSHIRSNKSKLFARIWSLRQNVDAMDAAIERDASSKEILLLVETTRREIGGFTADVIQDEIGPLLDRRQAAIGAIRSERPNRFTQFLRRYFK
jgi:DNA-binding FrmR family transcriptional regulator